MTTQEGNKIIAEFMGGVFYKDTPMLLQAKIISPSGNEITCIDKLRYHESWDWLMPVVEKISVVCKPNSKAHFWWNDCGHSDIRIFREPLTITYNTVIQFITWYNTQSK